MLQKIIGSFMVTSSRIYTGFNQFSASFSLIFTARVRSTREGNIYTWECLSVHHCGLFATRSKLWPFCYSLCGWHASCGFSQEDFLVQNISFKDYIYMKYDYVCKFSWMCLSDTKLSRPTAATVVSKFTLFVNTMNFLIVWSLLNFICKIVFEMK